MVRTGPHVTSTLHFVGKLIRNRNKIKKGRSFSTIHSRWPSGKALDW